MGRGQEAIAPELVALPGGERWKVGDTEFVYGYDAASPLDHFVIRKPPDLVQRYADLCRAFRHAAIVELGIAAGGSTAFLALLAQPRKLVACELAAEPVAALSQLIEAEGLSATIRPFYGVDQGDRARLADIVDTEFGRDPLDLVIDDASHLYNETKASFEVLFPRLRPDGLFVIEDWASDYMRAKWVIAALEDASAPDYAEKERRLAEAVTQRQEGAGPIPLHRLGAELMQVCLRSDVVSEVTTNSNWIVARRGPAELDPATFRLADHYTDDWQWLLG